jgi:hypothetical protein
MNKSSASVPLVILAVGVVLCGLLWVLGHVAHPLAEAIGVVIESFGAAVGLGVAAATTGFGTAGMVAPWLATSASAGLAAAGVGTTYYIIRQVVVKGKEKPYDWLLPALGLLAVFFVDLTKDELLSNPAERAIYALCTGLLTVGGGFLLMQKKIVVRAVGFLLPFLPAVMVWFLLQEQEHKEKVVTALKGSDIGMFGLIGVLVIGGVISILGVFLPRKD